MPIFPSFFLNKTGGYEIKQSLRFNSADSTNLSRTPSSTGNRKTFTVSCWVKRAQIGATQMIWSAGPASGGNIYLYFTSSDELQLSVDTEASGIVKTTQKFRDASAWYHIVCAVDTSQATASNRVKFFINGDAVSSFASASYPSQNHDTHWNHTSGHRIGQRNDGTAFYINAYIAEFYNLDGTAVSDAEDFAETDDNGVWRPIQTSGLTYGTNGFYLNFSNSSSLGEDQAGSNDWTANNFTTSGTGTDVMSDTPTTNWATLNPIYRSSFVDTNVVYSEGNLKASSNTNGRGAVGNFAVSSGKWYYEATKTNDEMIGWHPADTALSNYPGNVAGISFHGSGNLYHDGSVTAYGSGNYSAHVIGCAVDFDNEKFYWSIDGTWQNSADPAANTGGFSFPTSCQGVPLVPAFRVRSASSSESIIFNAGQRGFEYTAPTGYVAMNTANLPAPDIADGSQYFNTVLYTGDGASSRSITGVGFQPDWTWLKRRSGAADHSLYDVLRGATNLLQSSNTNAEQTLSNSLTSFDSDGFGVGTYENASSVTYVGWNWLAGGSGSSNTNGTITSTASVNATAGFSVVSWTGTGSAGSIGHGLGVAPSFVVVKNRTDAGYHWYTYHPALTSQYYLRLNDSTGQLDGASDIYPSAPSSTVVNLGGSTGVNGSSKNYIAYCFAEVESYSRIGSYVGNGSSDGPFVYCGFKPAWLLIKRTDSSSDWILQDSKRLGYNVDNNDLIPNQNYAEATDDRLDQLSNGFKLRSTFTTSNASGSTYIFIALAENPFGGDGVSPATAR